MRGARGETGGSLGVKERGGEEERGGEDAAYLLLSESCHGNGLLILSTYIIDSWYDTPHTARYVAFYLQLYSYIRSFALYIQVLLSGMRRMR